MCAHLVLVRYAEGKQTREGGTLCNSATIASSTTNGKNCVPQQTRTSVLQQGYVPVVAFFTCRACTCYSYAGILMCFRMYIHMYRYRQYTYVHVNAHTHTRLHVYAYVQMQIIHIFICMYDVLVHKCLHITCYTHTHKQILYMHASTDVHIHATRYTLIYQDSVSVTHAQRAGSS
jgi:hypothetical protein